jgi:hypothetical protein
MMEPKFTYDRNGETLAPVIKLLHILKYGA